MMWQDILAVPVIGAVPDDEDIVVSANQGEPLVGMQDSAGGGGLFKYLQTDFRGIGSAYGSGILQRDSGPHFRLFKEGIGGGADENAWRSAKSNSGEIARSRLKLLLVIRPVRNKSRNHRQ